MPCYKNSEISSVTIPNREKPKEKEEVCHFKAVSLAKNIEKIKDFSQNLTQKLDMICISQTRTNITNLKLIVTSSLRRDLWGSFRTRGISS